MWSIAETSEQMQLNYVYNNPGRVEMTLFTVINDTIFVTLNLHTIIIHNYDLHGTGRVLYTATKASRIGRHNYCFETERFVRVHLCIPGNGEIGTEPMPLVTSHRKHKCGGERRVVNTRCG